MSRTRTSLRAVALPRVALALLSAVAVLALAAGPARGQRTPLSPAEQTRVNRAIERGVVFLRLTQGPNGTWAREGGNQTGYAALPGLTLLECGANPRDPAVLGAAAFVRAGAAKLDTTYELALAILFLDRLGDPADKPVIQAMAMRLVAGQSPTGGWGYRCPPLTGRAHYDLLTALRQSEPASALAWLPPVPASPDPALPGDRKDGAAPDKAGGDGGSLGDGPRPSYSPRYGGCLKALDGPLPPPRGDGKGAAPRVEDKLFVPAPHLRGLSVFMDPKFVVGRDLPDRASEPLLPTTDNSNTQFAILALWAARRHDVPLKRTLAFVARRFNNSQAADGSWTYYYVPGGGDDRPAMSAVGLLGLAVGHGLDGDNRDGERPPVRDPRVARGFVALGRHVGKPAFRMNDVTQPNLYFLWSVERAAVLYGLGTIGDKDWYRWGAEALVANQAPDDGHWDKGGYPGATPTADTCLALLFLKQANLASDLTESLPVKADDLARAITDQSRPPVLPKAEERKDEKAITDPQPPAPGVVEGGASGKGGLADKPLPGLDDKVDAGKPKATPPAKSGAPAADRDEPASGRPLWLFVAIGSGALVLLGGLAVWQPWKRAAGADDGDDDDDDDDERPRRRRRPARRYRDDD